MTIQDDIRAQYPVFAEDFVARVDNRIATQFREATRMIGTIKAYQEQIEDIKQAIFELITERWLETAEGVNLDVLGDIIGQPRITLAGETEPLSDAQYLLFIRAKILTNFSISRYVDLYQNITDIFERSDFLLQGGLAHVDIIFVGGLDEAEIALLQYEDEDEYGQIRNFFPLTLGVGRAVYSGGPIFGYGPLDAGYVDGYYKNRII